jgi:hypothetical protein
MAVSFLKSVIVLLPPIAQQPLVGQTLLIIEASRSHSDTPHSVGRKDLCLTTHNTHKRKTSRPAGAIRTRNPSKRAVADARLRPRGHWDRLCHCTGLLQQLWQGTKTEVIVPDSHTPQKIVRWMQPCIPGPSLSLTPLWNDTQFTVVCRTDKGTY